jgi:hypothetical protein
MIFRRIKAHVQKENWFAVGIDFVIVVVGVFLGIQIGNWNDMRSDERAYQNAMMRLAEESFATLDEINDFQPAVEERIAKVQAAIIVLETCENDTSSEATLNGGLNIIRGHSFQEATTLALDQLIDEDRLLARQSASTRTILRDYHTQLHEMNEVATLVGQTLSPQENDRHPLIGFTGVLDPSLIQNGVDVRRARINAPLTVVCKDNSFVKQFYAWERAQVFQLWQSQKMKQVIEDTVKTLEFVRPSDANGEAP